MRVIAPYIQAPRARRVLSRSGATLCGACYDCVDPPPLMALNATATRVFALEAAEGNVRLLEAAFAAFGVAGRVSHVAASNVSGRAFVGQAGNESLAGFERSVVSTSRESQPHGHAVREVPALTLDAFVAAQQPPLSAPISLLTIDAEGADPLILEGARDLLRRQRVRVLEFEYHGLWPHDRTLRATLAFLEGHLYRCYWQGAFGSAPGDRAAPAGSGHLPALARAGARDDVWCGAFGVKMWSNLVCAHEPHIVKAFDAMAR